MKLVIDVEKTNSNLTNLSSEIDTFNSEVTSFDNEKINCDIEEIQSVLESYKSNVSDLLSKLKTSSNEYKVLVEECCNDYKANEENIQNINSDKITEIISNSSDLISYEGSAKEKLTGLPSTEIKTGSSTHLTGGSEAEQMWNYLKEQGFSDAGAAAIMGNLMQESGLHANNVQNHMGYEDDEYTNGIKNGTISRDSFVNDSRGYGIAQWTYHSRKANMYDTLGKENIDDLGRQLDFMIAEMGPDLTNRMKNATDISAATQDFEHTYERAGTPNMNARVTNAQTFYNEFSK